MDKLKDDVMQQSKPGKNHLNTNYSGLPLTCSYRDADLCIIILNKEIMDAIKETSASKKNIKNQEKKSLPLTCIFLFSDFCIRIK